MTKIIILLCLLLSVSACRVVPTYRIEYTSASQPSWVSSTQDFLQRGGWLYYRSIAENANSIEEARRLAATRGRLTMAEQIRTRIKSQFVLTIQSNHIISNHSIQDVFYEKVDGLILTGTHIEDSYYQKIRVKHSKQDQMFYRYYLLLKVSEADYNNAVQEAFSETIQDLPQYKKDLSNIYKQFNNN
ncbi:MAG: hypothetical protein IKN49_00890 [Elusimicrobiaceae bacterium]|nr:hypothetical protein [Elusimicrobiaceae bacterium]